MHIEKIENQLIKNYSDKSEQVVPMFLCVL